jgi:hypothetical protein
MKQQQAEARKQKQQHQRQIWQHVQSRLTEYNKILEEERALAGIEQPAEPQPRMTKRQRALANAAADAIEFSEELSQPSSSDTSGKRSIRWGLQNNTTKRMLNLFLLQNGM